MPWVGRTVMEWLDDGERMRSVERYAFIDSKGREWPFDAGRVTDGTSIPRILWTLVGSPFTGTYRRAGPPHDQAYSTPGVAKADADLMLREACLELGCPEWLAEAIYAGVRVGGLDAYAEDQRAAGLALG